MNGGGGGNDAKMARVHKVVVKFPLMNPFEAKGKMSPSEGQEKKTMVEASLRV